jgi:hypothetical protein
MVFHAKLHSVYYTQQGCDCDYNTYNIVYATIIYIYLSYILSISSST